MASTSFNQGGGGGDTIAGPSTTSSSSALGPDIFNPQISFPAITDSILNNLKSQFDEHLNWLDDYLLQAKKSDLFKSPKASSSSSSTRKSPSKHSSTSTSSNWTDILKSPVRKRQKALPIEKSNRIGVHNDDDAATASSEGRPISSLSYDSTLTNKHKNIFATGTGGGSSSLSNNIPLSTSIQSLSLSENNNNGNGNTTLKDGNNGLLRSPGKKVLQNLSSSQSLSKPVGSRNANEYDDNEHDKENDANAIIDANRSGGIIVDNKGKSFHGKNSGHIGSGRLGASTAPSTVAGGNTAMNRSPGLRSPLQSSTGRSRAQQQQQQQQPTYQSPLTRSQRTGGGVPPGSPAASSVAPSSSIPTRPASPSPTPRPISRLLRSPAHIKQSQHQPQQQQQDGKTTHHLSPTISRPPFSRNGTPQKTSSSSSTRTTPVRVVDDVFALAEKTGTGSTKQLVDIPLLANEEPLQLPQDVLDIDNDNNEESKNTEDLDDDEEIENILLGYTKTPATETAKRVLKSEAVRNLTLAKNEDKTVIKDKALPDVPPLTAASAILASSPIRTSPVKASPPRPAKSPARSTATASTTTAPAATAPTPSSTRFLFNNRNHSPVKRDMSNLASIASVLGSPVKFGNSHDASANTARLASGLPPSRPESPRPKSPVSRVPIPQSSTSRPASPARPRSPLPSKNTINTTNENRGDSSKPNSPSRISSRIAALASAATGRHNISSKTTPTASPQMQTRTQTSPRFGMTRSPRLRNAGQYDSPVATQQPRSPALKNMEAERDVQTTRVEKTLPDRPASRNAMVASNTSTGNGTGTSGLPTPSKLKRPMISPIQSPNSQRSLALSSLRKAVPGFETNAFTSPPASPRLPSTTSMSTFAVGPASTSVSTKSTSEKQDNVNANVKLGEELRTQHEMAINALAKSLPAPPQEDEKEEVLSEEVDKPAEMKSTPMQEKIAKPTGLSPPAKSPLRKMNSQNTLSSHDIQSLGNQHIAQMPKDATTNVQRELERKDAPAPTPTPLKEGNETIVPQATITRKTSQDHFLQGTAHKDTTVNIPVPPSPLFSSFLSNNNKRSSTLAFAGLPGRTLGGVGTGREKSIGLGLGLGKSLGAGSAKERINQMEDNDSQGSTASGSRNRQSFYATLASQGRKRLSSNIGFPDLDAVNKIGRTEASHTARASRISSQNQQNGTVLSQAARFDLLRSRISNIKGTSTALPPSTSRASFVPTSASQPMIPSSAAKAIARPITSENPVPEMGANKSQALTSLFSPEAATSTTTTQLQKIISPLPASTTSTFAATIASFVPAPAFSTSFANLFGASTTKLAQTSASLANNPQKDARDAIRNLQASEVAAKSPLYPSLPTLTNLHAALAVPSSPAVLGRQSGAAEADDDDQVEELMEVAQTDETPRVAGLVQQSSPLQVREKRSSSVQSIVSAIEAKENAAREERARESSISPRKASTGQPFEPKQTIQAKTPLPAAPLHKRNTRSTTPPFSPPAQQPVIKELDLLKTDRPESRMSDFGLVPPSDDPLAEKSLAGDVDIEDPGLEPIPRATSEETELQAMETHTDDGMTDMADGDEADSEGVSDNEVDKTASWHEPSKSKLQNSIASISLQKPSIKTGQSGFKPSRPVDNGVVTAFQSSFKTSKATIDKQEGQRQIKRPVSRAPSVSSLAPSRASTVSLSSTSSFNPSKSMGHKKANTSTSSVARPEIRSLQIAAAAAKKEQAEKERKAAMKEERTQKRLNKQDEQNGNSTQDPDRKRKERDDLAASQSTASQHSTTGQKVKPTVSKPKAAQTSKLADDQTKKRKVDPVEVVISKASVPKTTVVRPPQQKAAHGAQASTSKSSAPSSHQPSHAKALAASAGAIGMVKQGVPPHGTAQVTAITKGALHLTKPANQQAVLSQHQQAILSASIAFGKPKDAVASTSKAVEAQEPEVEPFQLPEIDSEYSDSDEDVQAQKAALRPVWTHSPELRQALAVQATFDPDRIFGDIPALHMEEMFKNPSTAARLRHRTSSAHWSGPDAISRYEEREYAKRMGFKTVNEDAENNAPT